MTLRNYVKRVGPNKHPGLLIFFRNNKKVGHTNHWPNDHPGLLIFFKNNKKVGNTNHFFRGEK